MAAVAGSSRDAYPPASPEPFPKSLKGRLKSSIETSLRHATRSKARAPGSAEDEHGRLPPAGGNQPKGKHPAGPGDDVRSKTPMLKRLESRVSSFRPPPAKQPADAERDRPSGFQIPSLRAASMSDPTLTLSAHTHRARPALLASVMTDVFAPVLLPPPSPPAPTRSSKRSSFQPTPSLSISGPSPLRRSGDPPRALHAHREPARSSVDLPRTAARSPEPPTRSGHDVARKSKPPQLYSSVVAPSSPPRRPASPASPVGTPTRQTRVLPSEPPTPTPSAGSKVLGSMRKGSTSSSALPLSPRTTSPPPPIGERNASPALRAKSPSSRRVVAAPARGMSSSSASHLPLGSSVRRPSLDITSSRPSLVDGQARRPSLDARPSASSIQSDSPATSRAASPRTMTPSPVPGSHNLGRRARNVSSSSISTTSSPEHRELIRAAASLLCRELGRNSAQLRRNGFSDQDYEEIEVRIRNLVRLERIWTKGGGGVASNSGVSANGEERERRAFTEALRDGYVLCQ
jgi:hypothetical protein